MLLGRLKIWQKLALIGIGFAIPIAVTTVFLWTTIQGQIDFNQDEIYGDAYLRPVARLLDEVSRHRALARQPEAAARLPEQQRKVEAAFVDLFRVDAELGSTLRTDAANLAQRGKATALPSIMKKNWDALKSAGAATAAHDALIADIRNFYVHIGDMSNLILDPDLDTYYTMDALLVQAPDQIDRLHALGEVVDGLIARGKVTPEEQADLLQRLALIRLRRENFAADMQTVYNEAPNFSKSLRVQPALSPAHDSQATSVDALIALTMGSVATRDVPRVEAAAYRAALDRALVDTMGFLFKLFEEEDDMIGTRVGGFRGQRLYYVSVISLVLLGVLALAFAVLRSVTVPIAKAVAVAARLAKGELPDKIEVGAATDETGVLLRAINDMLQFLNLRETIETLQTTAVELTSAVVNLERQTVEQAEAISRQASALQETQVTAQEISETSKVAAAKAQDVIRVVERADAVGRSGESAIEQSLAGMADIRLQVESIAAKITELSERTIQIGGITQTVKDLADQSNMLALNAAIEAVRSGEHGKGFAVVAREIRSLADQSIQATNRVQEILDSISGAIRMAVSITESGSQRMEAGLVQVKTSGDNLRELSAIVRDSSASVRQIAAAVSQQNAGITQIFTAVTEQTRMMDDTVARLEVAKGAAVVVKSAASRVSELSVRFKV